MREVAAFQRIKPRSGHYKKFAKGEKLFAFRVLFPESLVYLPSARGSPEERRKERDGGKRNRIARRKKIPDARKDARESENRELIY